MLLYQCRSLTEFEDVGDSVILTDLEIAAIRRQLRPSALCWEHINLTGKYRWPSLRY
jgi:hypothetical protein